MSYLDNVEEESIHELSMSKYSSPSKQKSEVKVIRQFEYEHKFSDPVLLKGDEKSKLVSLEIELQEMYSTIEALKDSKLNLEKSYLSNTKQVESNWAQKLQSQKEEYESKTQSHQSYIDQLLAEKASLNAKLEWVLQEKVDWDAIITRREKELKERFDIDLNNK